MRIRITSFVLALAVSAMYAAVPGGLPSDGGIASWSKASDPALRTHASRVETRLARHEGRAPSPAGFAPPAALLSHRSLAPLLLACETLGELACFHPVVSVLATAKTCRGPPAHDVAV